MLDTHATHSIACTTHIRYHHIPADMPTSRRDRGPRRRRGGPSLDTLPALHRPRRRDDPATLAICHPTMPSHAPYTHQHHAYGYRVRRPSAIDRSVAGRLVAVVGPVGDGIVDKFFSGMPTARAGLPATQPHCPYIAHTHAGDISPPPPSATPPRRRRGRRRGPHMYHR